MQVEDVKIDIEKLRYDEDTEEWIVDSVDLDESWLADIEEMTDLIDERVKAAVENARRLARHDREMAVDDSLMHFIQALLDAASGLRPTDERVLRILKQVRAG